MIYDEVEYWNNRKKPNSAPHSITLQHIEYVENHLHDCNEILDLGPGVGRIFPAYNNISFVQGYDISELYKDTVIKESNRYSFEFNLFTKKKISKLPFSNNEFDAVVCVSVLMHQKPVNVIEVMKECVRVGKKAIFISYIDINKKFGFTGSKHIFNYNYITICNENDWKMVDIYIIDNQIYFCCVDEK
jgi:ubiquinone/menaquinone biosynthesis C-methylase UbiE